MDEKVPGGEKIALAEGESLHDSDSDRDDAGALSRTDRMSRRRTTSRSLPRFQEDNITKVSGARKVDSLPVKILDEPYGTTADKRTRAKKMIRSFGSFMQKVARQITSVTLYAASPVTKFKLPGKEGDSACVNFVSSKAADSGVKSHIRMAGSENGEKPPGVVGIHNHGNTCFMNAVLQCLSNTEVLLAYFIKDQYKEDIKRSNKHNAKKFGTRGELTEHLAMLLKSLWNCKYTPEISSDFKAIVAKYGCQYRGSSQHDAQEFLIWLLDKVHEDLNIATKKKYRANRSSYGRSDEDVAAEALANHARCNNSFIYDIFQALYRSSLTCPNCSHRSTTFDPFLSVSLPIPHKNSQPVYVTVVHFGSAARQIRYGFLMDQECQASEIRHAISNETLLPVDSIIVVEVENCGASRTLNDGQLVGELSENVCLYAFEQPRPIVNELTAAGDGSSESITVMVVKKLINGATYQRFGSPLLMQVSSRCLGTDLKAEIVQCMTSSEADLIGLAIINKDVFHLKLEEPNVSIDDSYLPFSSDKVTRALSSLPSGCNSPFLLLSAEWETSADLPASISEQQVEEHESVRQVKASVQQSSLSTLDECFHVYTQEEQLGPDNAWLCPSCRKYQQGTVKALTLWSLPEVLVIHLKRFKQDAIHRTKLNTLVMFPINGLDLRHHVQRANISSVPTLRSSKSGAWTTWKAGRKQAESPDDYLYDLYAVCNHYGDMHGGHYTAFCKNLSDGQWYSFNDSKATEMREEEVVTRAAYLLFYQKRSSHLLHNCDWLQTLQQIDYNVPRTVTSHSLDDLLDKEGDTAAVETSPDDDFRLNIPVYTEHCPPARITRRASACRVRSREASQMTINESSSDRLLNDREPGVSSGEMSGIAQAQQNASASTPTKEWRSVAEPSDIRAHAMNGGFEEPSNEESNDLSLRRTQDHNLVNNASNNFMKSNPA